MTSSEGDHATYDNTLQLTNVDDSRRGTSIVSPNQPTMYYAWTGQTSNDMWVHLRLVKPNGSGHFNNTGLNTFVEIRSSLGTLAGLRQLTRNANVVMGTRTASAPTTGVFSGPTAYYYKPLEPFDVDFHFLISTTTNTDDTLALDYYINQQVRESYVLTNAGGWSPPDRLHLRPNDFKSAAMGFQDIIITNGIPTVGMQLVTMPPTSDGTYTDFTGTFADVDDLGYDPDDAHTTNTLAARQSWQHTAPSLTLSDRIIVGFSVNIVGRTDTATIVGDLQPFVRLGGVDYAGTNGTTTVTTKSFANVWTQNPATTAPWVESDFTSIQTGVLTV